MCEGADGTILSVGFVNLRGLVKLRFTESFKAEWVAEPLPISCATPLLWNQFTVQVQRLNLYFMFNLKTVFFVKA